MAEESAKLRIPYLAAAQAQKHVTHNEAMTLLDTLVQLSVKDKDLATPPGSPAEGDCYIVAASATGAWVGWDKRVARFIDGGWRSYLPGAGSGAGWLAYVIDESALYAFNGTDWVPAGLQLGAYVDLAEASPPSSPGPDVARLYAKDVSGVTKLVFKDSVGTETMLGTGSGVSDGDKGDVIVSGSGTVWTIDTNAVTYAKMQDVSATARILGRKTAGSGDPEECTLSDVLDFIGSAAQGDILYRGASGWTRLAAGTAGFRLQTGGAGANPSWAPAREVLTAARTYYVRTDGSDSNNGLTNSSGGAFLTLQKAIDIVVGLDLSIYDVTIQLGNGTYTGANVFKSTVGAGTVIILGDTTTPSNVVISVTAATAFSGSGFRGKYSLRGVKITATTSGAGINIAGAGGALGIQNVEFGAVASSAHIVAGAGAFISLDGNYTISGNAPRHYLASGPGAEINGGGITVTLSGTPAFSSGFAVSEELARIRATSFTFSGAATGARYSSTLNALVNSNGGGANYFPGNAAGSTGTGGLYA